MTELMRRRRALMVEQGGGGLPSIYQQVEYVYADKGPYIITDYYPNAKTDLKIKYNFTINSNSYQAIFGFISGNNPYSRFQMLKQKAGGYFCSRGSTEGGTSTGIANPNEDVVMRTYPSNTWFFSGYGKYSYGDNDFSKATVLPLAFWGTNRSSGVNLERLSTCRIYYVEIKEDDELKMNLVPCYRKADTEIGLYDTVSGTFYTNSGTGSFAKGADV